MITTPVVVMAQTRHGVRAPWRVAMILTLRCFGKQLFTEPSIQLREDGGNAGVYDNDSGRVFRTTGY